MGYKTKDEIVTIKQLWKIQDEAVALFNQGEELEGIFELTLMSRAQASVVISHLVRANEDIRNG